MPSVHRRRTTRRVCVQHSRSWLGTAQSESVAPLAAREPRTASSPPLQRFRTRGYGKDPLSQPEVEATANPPLFLSRPRAPVISPFSATSCHTPLPLSNPCPSWALHPLPDRLRPWNSTPSLIHADPASPLPPLPAHPPSLHTAASPPLTSPLSDHSGPSLRARPSLALLPPCPVLAERPPPGPDLPPSPTLRPPPHLRSPLPRLSRGLPIFSTPPPTRPNPASQHS